MILEGTTLATAIAVDVNGSAYVNGVHGLDRVPDDARAHQRTHRGGHDRLSDVFVTKLSPNGDALSYSTFLGGSDDEFWLEGGIAVDIAGNAYVVGDTESTDFPVTAGVLDSINTGSRTGFAVKLNGTGGAIYATYLTGFGQTAGGVAVDPAGNAYVTGIAVGGLATTPGDFSRQRQVGGMRTWPRSTRRAAPSSTPPTWEPLDTKREPTSRWIPYGRAYLVGWTMNPTFPVSDAAFQRVNAGPADTKDGFLTVFLEGGDRLCSPPWSAEARTITRQESTSTSGCKPPSSAGPSRSTIRSRARCSPPMVETFSMGS